jgi:hypothetical protein
VGSRDSAKRQRGDGNGERQAFEVHGLASFFDDAQVL